MLSSSEERILKKIAESQLITKTELKNYLKNNGGAMTDSAIEIVTRGLVQKDMITTISPVGSTCFIITKKGASLLKQED